MSSEIRVVESWPEPANLEHDASATVALVREHLSEFSPKLKLDLPRHWWSFALPCPSDAEYQFTVHGGLDGERQIAAHLMQFAQNRRRHRFWYSPLEMAHFRNDASSLEKSFHDRVTSLLTRPTRIMEKKGVVWLSYRAEYLNETGWHNLRGGVTYLGLGLGIPFFGKKRIYSSPPLTSVAQP